MNCFMIFVLSLYKNSAHHVHSRWKQKIVFSLEKLIIKQDFKYLNKKYLSNKKHLYTDMDYESNIQ